MYLFCRKDHELFEIATMVLDFIEKVVLEKNIEKVIKLFTGRTSTLIDQL